MLMHRRRIQHSVSTQSIDSSSTINEDGVDIALPTPTNIIECNEELTKHQAELEVEKKELSILSQNVKELRRQKEPLIKIKDVLQQEITNSNEIINRKSEEVTQIKNKLRHHSEKQILSNIDRLEYQLRINNYKPKEEQKILDEISMLQRSIKSLKEYNLKELENKKYRIERNRLIEERNEIYSNIHIVYGREEKEKREVNKMRRKVAETTKLIDHLMTCRSQFEHAKIEEKKQKEELVKKRLEEKARTKKDQYIKRQEDRRKLWEEYEASREPYEEEKARCKVLIAYMENLLPSSERQASSFNGEDTVDEPKVTLTRSQTAPARTTCEARLETLKSSPLLEKLDGIFYSKQKDESNTARRMSKKEKAKAKKELKNSKSKVLSHTPAVLADLLKLNLPIPKTSDAIPHVLDMIKATLSSFYQLDDANSSAETVDSKIGQSVVGEIITINVSNDVVSARPATNYSHLNGVSSDGDVEVVGCIVGDGLANEVTSTTSTETLVLSDSSFSESPITAMTLATAKVAV